MSAETLPDVKCRKDTTCLSCYQTPLDIEKDLLPEKQQLVRWDKRAKDPVTGNRDICEGIECTECLRYRNHSFAGVAQGILNKSRSSNPVPALQTLAVAFGTKRIVTNHFI
jgi:hypothetical protein